MKRGISFFLGTTAVLAASAAHAQDEAFDLGLLVLSGGLVPIAEADLQRSFTTIDAEEIEQKGFESVLDALRTVPGFQPSVGGLNSFRIRGAQSNHALVLVDGIEVQTTSNGDYELGNIPVSDIERIEVLRGPQSAVYGANAASGVINIITKGGKREPGVSGRIGVEAGGPSGIRSLSFGINLSGERGFAELSFANKTTADFDISNDDDGENDVFRATVLTLKSEYDLTDAFTVGLILRQLDRAEDYDDTKWPFLPTDAKKDYIVDADNTRNDKEVSGALYVQGQSADGRVDGELRFSAMTADRDFNGNFGSTSARQQYRARLSYGIDGTVDTADNLITAVIEQETETYEQGSVNKDRDTRSVAAEYRGRFFDALSLQLGVRRDNNTDFQDATTWNAAVGYELATGTTLRASGGKGIINPSFFEQFGFSGNFVGNSDLTPEILTGWDIGVDQEFMDGRGLISLTYFEQQIEDNITSETVAGRTRPINQDGTSHQHGVELAAQFAATETLSVDMAYTYTHATDPDGDRSIRIPQHQLNLGARLETFGGKGDVWAQLNHVSGIEDLDRRDFSTTSLDAYTLVNIGATYQFMENAELYGRIDNLTEQTYEEQWGYERSDRTIAFGFRSTF